jgi:hypothetical protein
LAANQPGDIKDVKVLLGWGEAKAAFGTRAKGFIAAATTRNVLNEDKTLRVVGLVSLPHTDKQATKMVTDNATNTSTPGFMHAGYKGRELKATVAHELAHIEDSSHITTSSGRQIVSDRSSGGAGVPVVSGYARTNVRERYAEAKSLFQVGTDDEMGEHRDGLYETADRFGWVKL